MDFIMYLVLVGYAVLAECTVVNLTGNLFPVLLLYLEKLNGPKVGKEKDGVEYLVENL